MNSRTKLSAKELKKLREQHPGVPEEYLGYLGEVGAGAFRECQFRVYEGLGTPDDILGKGVFDWWDPKKPVLCFGDNYSGDLSGFLPQQKWAVVELWHDSGTVYPVKKTFGKYIRERMLMGPKGEDLREH
jgi:hypothetical protein